MKLSPTAGWFLKLEHPESSAPIPTAAGGDDARLAAFTLTELLVVIVILGILASLIAASVISGKHKAREAECLANLRQQGLALSTFLTDHGEFPLMMSARESDRYPDHRRFWRAALFPEHLNQQGAIQGDPKVFDCPSASTPREFPETMGFADYGYNAWGLGGLISKPLLGIGGKGPGPIMEGRSMVARYSPPVAESEVLNPSEMLAIGDSFNGWKGVIKDGLAVMGRGPDVQEFMGSTARSHRRHRGRANVLFCDGHVDAPKLDFLFRDESDQALRIWNRDNQPHRERLAP